MSTTPDSPWRDEFPILDDCIFLNHASVSPIPARAHRAIAQWADEALHRGGEQWLTWAGRIKQTRNAAATLLNCSWKNIGFIHNTTHGILCVANSLDWRPGDNVVTVEHEFPANVYPWLNLVPLGVEIRRAPRRPDFTYDPAAIVSLIDSRTRVVALSLVQYATGFRMPVEPVAEACRARGVLLLLDSIQAIGALPVDPAALGADFLVADSHKWMLGPEGAGIIYAAGDALGQLNDTMTGWVGRPRPAEYQEVQPVVQTAARFEEGSHNMAGLIGMGAALELLNEVGSDEIWRRIEALTAHLRERLAGLELAVVSPGGEGQRSGIVSVAEDGWDAADVMRRLMEREIHLTARHGLLRFAPHFYNTTGQLDAAVEALGECIATARRA